MSLPLVPWGSPYALTKMQIGNLQDRFFTYVVNPVSFKPTSLNLSSLSTLHSNAKDLSYVRTDNA